MHELRQPARNAAELMTLAAGLQAAGIRLELLSGPLTASTTQAGWGRCCSPCWPWPPSSTAITSATRPWREQIAAAKGNHGGRLRVIDEDILTFAQALRDKGVPVPQIAAKLTISSGKNAGKRPSVASMYRALADADASSDDGRAAAGAGRSDREAPAR